VSKLVLNICVGESGDRLQKAAKVLSLDPPLQLACSTTAQLRALLVELLCCVPAHQCDRGCAKCSALLLTAVDSAAGALGWKLQLRNAPGACVRVGGPLQHLVSRRSCRGQTLSSETATLQHLVSRRSSRGQTLSSETVSRRSSRGQTLSSETATRAAQHVGCGSGAAPAGPVKSKAAVACSQRCWAGRLQCGKRQGGRGLKQYLSPAPRCWSS